MNTNERSCHGATTTLQKSGLTLLTAALAFVIYGAAPAEAKPKATATVLESHQTGKVQEAAYVREFPRQSRINEDFDDSYAMENPSGGG